MMDPAVKDEICWQMMNRVRRTAMKRGISPEDMTDEQHFSVFKRSFRTVRESVERGIA
jgi:hypothetical protein